MTDKSQAKKYFEEANNSFFDDDFAASLTFISKAIDADSTNPEFFIRRAQIQRKLKDTAEAASDAKKASELTAGKPEALKAHYKALQLYGTCQFENQDYLGSTLTFLEAQRINSDDSVNKEYIEKAKAHVSEEELAAAQEKAREEAISEAIRKKATEVRHQWYQNDTIVTVDIFIKKAKKENVTLEFNKDSVKFSHKAMEGVVATHDFEPLFASIVPEESSYQVLSTKIELRLKKESAGTKWAKLTNEKEEKEASQVGYPTSSRISHNWDKIAKDTENDPELKPEGEQALTAMFQQIYKDADEDTRRAMIKSYQESNGTTLSTNWSEVGKGKVETKPPDSMIAKKYEV